MTIHDAAKVGRPIAQALNSARAEARKKLAVSHPEEFEALVVQIMAERGYTQTTETIVKTKWNGAQ